MLIFMDFRVMVWTVVEEEEGQLAADWFGAGHGARAVWRHMLGPQEMIKQEVA